MEGYQGADERPAIIERGYGYEGRDGANDAAGRDGLYAATDDGRRIAGECGRGSGGGRDVKREDVE